MLLRLYYLNFFTPPPTPTPLPLRKTTQKKKRTTVGWNQSTQIHKLLLHESLAEFFLKKKVNKVGLIRTNTKKVAKILNQETGV